LVTDYCLKHLQLWFWFAAVIFTALAPKTGQDFTIYRAKYLCVANGAQECCVWLKAQFNHLLKEKQNE
jgi:hypothetical protein